MLEQVDVPEGLDGVEQVRIYREPGLEMRPLRRGADRAGAVLAVGSSRDEALDRGDRAAAAIGFHVDAIRALSKVAE